VVGLVSLVVGTTIKIDNTAFLLARSDESASHVPGLAHIQATRGSMLDTESIYLCMCTYRCGCREIWWHKILYSEVFV